MKASWLCKPNSCGQRGNSGQGIMSLKSHKLEFSHVFLGLMEKESDLDRNRQDSSGIKDHTAHKARQTPSLDSWFPLHEAFPVQEEALWTKSTLLESTNDWRSRGKCYTPNRAGKSGKDASKHTHDSLI